MNKYRLANTGFSEMRRHEVLLAAIGKYAIELAEELGLSPEAVRQWMREPFGEESPTATGKKSPLDRWAEFFIAVDNVTPEGADLLVDYVRWLQQRQRRRNAAAASPAELLAQFTKLRTELNQTIQALEIQVGQEAPVVALNGHR